MLAPAPLQDQPLHSALYRSCLNLRLRVRRGRDAVLLSHHGRAEEAVAYTTRIMRLDPLHPPNYTYYLGKGHFFAGRLDDSYPMIKAASAQLPTDRPSKVLLAAVTVLTNRPDEARAAVAQLLRIDPKFTITNWMTFMRVSHEPSARQLVAALKQAGLPE